MTSLLPIVERILDGDVPCPSEINLFNARRLFAWINATELHHTKETCKKGKDCVHAPGEYTKEWALFLIQEASEKCTCGEHKKG